MPGGACRSIFNPAFTILEDSVNRDRVSDMDSLFRQRNRGFLSVRLSGLWHDPGKGYLSNLDARKPREPIDIYSRLPRCARSSFGA